MGSNAMGVSSAKVKEILTLGGSESYQKDLNMYAFFGTVKDAENITYCKKEYHPRNF